MAVRKYLLAVIAVILLVILAGCVTQGHYYSEGKSKVVKIYKEADRLYKQKQYDDAKEYFQQIVTNHSESPLAELAMYHLGCCYKEQKQYQKAISTYQELINKYHTGPWADLAKKDIEEIESTQAQ